MKKLIIVSSFLLMLTLTLAFKNTTINTFPLFSKLFIIDVGHGGLDPGSIYNKFYEKDYNLLFAKTFKRKLETLGASVIMTREGDYDLSSPNSTRRKRSDFDNRIRLIEESKPDMYISLHMNYLDNSNYNGAQAFYSSVNSENKNIALLIQGKVNVISGSDRDIKKISNDKYLYRNLKTKGVLIEFGFLSSSKDRNNLKNEEYREILSKAISDAIIEYYE